MSWVEHHENSERLASQAQVAVREGRRDDALALYARAADAEDRALTDLDPSKTRTLGITAVSVAWLRYRANQFDLAKVVVDRSLKFKRLPAFAISQLRSLRRTLRGKAPPPERPSRRKTSSLQTPSVKVVADPVVVGSGPDEFVFFLPGSRARSKTVRVYPKTAREIMARVDEEADGIVLPGEEKVVGDEQTAEAVKKGTSKKRPRSRRKSSRS